MWMLLRSVAKPLSIKHISIWKMFIIFYSMLKIKQAFIAMHSIFEKTLQNDRETTNLQIKSFCWGHWINYKFIDIKFVLISSRNVIVLSFKNDSSIQKKQIKSESLLQPEKSLNIFNTKCFRCSIQNDTSHHSRCFLFPYTFCILESVTYFIYQYFIHMIFDKCQSSTVITFWL